MNKILPRGGLLDFNLCYVDPDEEKRQILRRLSDATGRIVIESDPAAQIALAVLPSIVQARAGADAAAKTSLVSYATGAALDRLGACVGCVRFPVGPSKVRFALERAIGNPPDAPSESAPFNVKIVLTSSPSVEFSGTFSFTWAENATLSNYVTILCNEDGEQNNGLLQSQMTITLSDESLIYGYVSDKHMLPSFGGSSGELDEPYAQRIYLANRAISAAGSASYFESIARNVGPEVWDAHAGFYEWFSGGQEFEVLPVVFVHSPIGGEDTILGTTSNAGALYGVKDAIAELVYMGARVEVATSFTVKPTAEIFKIGVWLEKGIVDLRGEEAVMLDITSAYDDFIQWLRAKMGRSFSLAELSALLVPLGAYRVEATDGVVDLRASGVDFSPFVLDFSGVPLELMGVQPNGRS